MDDIPLSSSSRSIKPSANPRISIADSKEADENTKKFTKNQKQLPMKHFLTPTIPANPQIFNRSPSLSSTPIQPSANIKISIADSEEADENGKMSKKNQNLEQLPMKNFMTPTISSNPLNFKYSPSSSSSTPIQPSAYRRMSIAGVDFLSNLPDELIDIIMSFLTTKDAVKQGVVSKRFSMLWTKVPSLVFEETRPNSELVKCVDKVVSLNNASHIKVLSLKLQLPKKFPLLGKWIRKALSRNVPVMDLCLVPTSTISSNLKKLVLKMVTLDGCLEQIFQGCRLEDLSLLDCNFFNPLGGHRNVINIPTLRKLRIKSDRFWEERNYCSISVASPNLKYLRCSTDLMISIGLPAKLFPAKLSTLDDVVIQISSKEILSLHSRYFVRRLINLIYGLLSIRCLCISQNSLWSMLKSKGIYDKLTHLKVGGNGALADHVNSYIELLMFLQQTPQLEILQLYEFHDLEDHYDYEMVDVPFCMRSSLKSFEILNFRGRDAEIQILSYMLENASCLEDMTLSYRTKYTTMEESEKCIRKEKLESTIELLKTLARRSSRCLIRIRCRDEEDKVIFWSH